MKATFNVKITIEDRKVFTKLGEGTMDDIEILLLQKVMTVIKNVENSVTREVNRYYASADEMNTDGKPEAGTTSVESQESAPESEG